MPENNQGSKYRKLSVFILLSASFIMIILTLYVNDSITIDVANAISRPYVVQDYYQAESIQYHLQKSSQDATKTPACSSLYVIISVVYTYTIYLLSMHKHNTKKNTLGYELIHPL